MEMQIPTTQTNWKHTHSHTTNKTSMGERKLYIFHTKSTPSTTPSQPALEYPGTLTPWHPAAVAHPAKWAHLNSVSAFSQLRVKSV